jgi:hypothetical protein
LKIFYTKKNTQTVRKEKPCSIILLKQSLLDYHEREQAKIERRKMNFYFILVHSMHAKDYYIPSSRAYD